MSTHDLTRHVAPLELRAKVPRDLYKYFVPTGLQNLLLDRISSFAQDSVSRMQVTDGKGNEQMPLTSAFCWKCCSVRKL